MAQPTSEWNGFFLRFIGEAMGKAHDPAPRVVDAGLGVVATVFAIALTWVYNRTSAGN
jgi:hypothetical protein